MSGFRVRPVTAIFMAIVIMLSLSTTAFTLQSATPSASMTLSANPNTVAAGGQVTITGTIQNTSSATERVTIAFDVHGPCSYEHIATVKVVLKAGETRTASMSYTVPNCAGTYTITATATSGQTVLTTASTSFTVQ